MNVVYISLKRTWDFNYFTFTTKNIVKLMWPKYRASILLLNFSSSVSELLDCQSFGIPNIFDSIGIQLTMFALIIFYSTTAFFKKYKNNYCNKN